MQRSAKITLTAIIVVCTLPVIASYLAFYVWKPQDSVNYGELMSPSQLPDATLSVPAGLPGVDRGSMNGHWTLVYAGPAACGDACQQALYTTRQTRLAQGKEMGRVSRLWLVTDGGTPAPALLEAHPELRVAHADPRWLPLLPGAEQGAFVYLVDPLGNVMMRFPEQADIKLVIKDLQRLLKYSGLG